MAIQLFEAASSIQFSFRMKITKFNHRKVSYFKKKKKNMISKNREIVNN